MKLFALAMAMTLGLTNGKCPGDVQCSKCTGSGACERCIDSFYNIDRCDTDITPIAHCWGYDSKNTCNQCDFGFFLKDNACVPCKVAGCALCKEIDTCGACFGGVVTDGKSCASPLPKCIQENCDICMGTEFCVMCNNGFALNKLHECKASTKNCFVSKNNICSICYEGFYLTEQGTCEVVPTRVSSNKFLFVAIGVVVVLAIIAAVFFASKKGTRANEEYTRAEPA